MVAAQTLRRWILTGSVTAITVTGAMYGASLKQDLENTKRKQQVAQLSTEEQIAQLEVMRESLVNTKKELERRMENAMARQRGEQPGEGNRRS